MGLGSIQSIESLNRTKKAKEGQMPFLSSWARLSILSSPWTSTLLVLGLWDSGTWTKGCPSSQIFGLRIYYNIQFLVLQLADDRSCKFSASITIWDNRCKACPCSWPLLDDFQVTDSNLYPEPQHHSHSTDTHRMPTIFLSQCYVSGMMLEIGEDKSFSSWNLPSCRGEVITINSIMSWSWARTDSSCVCCLGSIWKWLPEEMKLGARLLRIYLTLEVLLGDHENTFCKC